MVDPRNGEEWQHICGRDQCARPVACYLDRNYYTTEDAARVICRIALPPEGLQGMSLVAKNADGQTLAEAGKLRPEHTLAIPLQGLPLGQQTVAVELRQAGGQTATRLELQLVKRAPQPGCEGKLTVKTVLLDNGRPFFPYGFIMANIWLMTNGRYRTSAMASAVYQWGGPAGSEFAMMGEIIWMWPPAQPESSLAPDMACRWQ